jgi:hypothetical protein
LVRRKPRSSLLDTDPRCLRTIVTRAFGLRASFTLQRTVTYRPRTARACATGRASRAARVDAHLDAARALHVSGEVRRLIADDVDAIP